MSVTIMIGDVREQLRKIAYESVHCVVTSPPYWGLRDYGVDGQIGPESSPAEFIAVMVDVFEEVRRVLRSDGTCWINMGDSYAGNGAAYGDAERTLQGRKQSLIQGARRQEKKGVGLKSKDLCMMPHRLAIALQDAGWWVRQDIVWAKPNPMPESVTDRCTKAHEYIFLLTKSAKYYFDADAIREECVKGSAGSEFHTGKTGAHQLGRASMKPRLNIPSLGRNKRSVWTMSTHPFSEAHFATFPPELPETCIKAGCPPGGIVLDPFFGAGTTGLVAERLQRQCIGIELNPAYAEMARKRIASENPLFSSVTCV